MPKIIDQTSVIGQAWFQSILPGFEDLMDPDCTIRVTDLAIRVDNSTERVYDHRQPAGIERRKSSLPI